ncbi:2474_t:CDS:2, partial [Ambispora leptoticha]
ILIDGSVNFVKTYHTHSWNYYGQRRGTEIWGRWGNGTPNSGVFLIWRHGDEGSGGSSMSQWDGQYNIFYTNEPNQPNLSTSQLTFSAHNFAFFIAGSGIDVVGPYTINNGQFIPSSRTITFTKSYTNHNLAWIYRGQYNGELFFGKWGTNNQPNLGSFIIRRVFEVGTHSFTGNWRGYYFYSTNDNSDQMSINLKSTGNAIDGSGSDSVGSFKINGQILIDGSVNFVKTYHTHSWNYYGQRRGAEIWGRWGNGTPNSGVFLIWRHGDSGLSIL